MSAGHNGPDMDPHHLNGVDPARGRFFTIQAVRLAGVASVVAGMLASNGRLPAPVWLGYVLLAAGLVGVFVLPPILVRKWRTPR
jgi:hypothetical protein